MLEHLTSPDPKLTAFMQHTAKQFITCAVRSGLIKLEEVDEVERLINQQVVEHLSGNKDVAGRKKALMPESESVIEL